MCQGMRIIYPHAAPWSEGRSPRVVFHFASVNASGDSAANGCIWHAAAPSLRKSSYQESGPFCSQRFAAAIGLGASFALVSRITELSRHEVDGCEFQE